MKPQIGGKFMKTSSIKKGILTAALSVALVATVSGSIHNPKADMAENHCYEIAGYQTKAMLNVKQKEANISETNQENESDSIEMFVSSAVDEPIDTIDFSYNDLYSVYDENFGYVLDFHIVPVKDS